MDVKRENKSMSTWWQTDVAKPWMTRFWKCWPSDPLIVQWGNLDKPPGASIQQVGVRAVAWAEVEKRTRSPSQGLTKSLPGEGGPSRAAEGWAGTGQVSRFHAEEGGHAQDVISTCPALVVPPWSLGQVHSSYPQQRPNQVVWFYFHFTGEVPRSFGKQQGYLASGRECRLPPNKTREFSTTHTCLLGWQVSIWDLLM